MRYWQRRGIVISAIILLTSLLTTLPLSVSAQDSWLDGTRQGWNSPGMAIPDSQVASMEPLAACDDLARPPETPEDEAVIAAGWQLYGTYQQGWGVTLVGGYINRDAMCRPIPYQQFVFVDGEFAGTLSPEPMWPRTDGALITASIASGETIYAWYDRYAPTDPLCCPSSETGVTFHVERAAAGPVVIPDSVMAQASPSTAAAATSAPESGLTAVCVNLGTGGDSLAKVNWTREEITAHEARFGPVPEPHPATGTCSDPAGLPVTPGAINEFSWLCFRTFDGRWYGPDWTADMYRTGNEVPPDPAIGGCPQPRATEIPLPPPSEQAAATAVYLSQLEAAGDLDTLVAWLHRDAQTAVSRSEVIDWYTTNLLPRGPGPISVTSVELGAWTWPATGTAYPKAAEISYEQPFADGTVASGTMHLVPDEHGLWRWFFGQE